MMENHVIFNGLLQLKRYLFTLLLFSGLLFSVTASDEFDIIIPVDEAQFPAYTLVTTTELPPLDRIDLARRLRGVTNIPVQNAVEIVRQTGEIEIFRINSVEGGGTADIPARLSAIGEHVYLWVEDGIPVENPTLIDLVQRFDIQVYEFVRGLWGSEPVPGIDGESRLHIVFTSRLRQGLGGYFSSTNSYPASVAPDSNEYDMMILSTGMLEPQNINTGISAAAHEFQHMIHHVNDSNEYNWLNEGLATFTEYLPGLNHSQLVLDAFAQAPETSLNMWGLGTNRPAEYGAPTLFMIYLYDRFGLDAVQEIARDTDNGLQSVNNMLQSRNESPVDVIFADWVLANLLREQGGHYGYQSLIDIAPVNLRARELNLPSVFSFDLHQYGTHYYQYENLPETVTISLQMPETVPLIPVNASSGQMMWYSQRGDSSNPRLTRAFDLRNVSSARLDFNIRYDLENEWDYGYVSVSVDNGQTWELQSIQHTTTANSNRRAYGEGYTGQSTTWLADSLALDAYVGQEILLRFEMVTDDAINYAGIAIDDMSLEAVGYRTDLEADNGGWVSEGWIHTDNRLPQRAWVQIVEQGNSDVLIHRFLADGDEQWQLDLQDSTASIQIAISPFAPMTTVPLSYSLQVE